MRCQLPTEDQYALISATSNEDLSNLIDEYDLARVDGVVGALKICSNKHWHFRRVPIRRPQSTQEAGILGHRHIKRPRCNMHIPKNTLQIVFNKQIKNVAFRKANE